MFNLIFFLIIPYLLRPTVNFSSFSGQPKRFSARWFPGDLRASSQSGRWRDLRRIDLEFLLHLPPLCSASRPMSWTCRCRRRRPAATTTRSCGCPARCGPWARCRCPGGVCLPRASSSSVPPDSIATLPPSDVPTPFPCKALMLGVAGVVRIQHIYIYITTRSF